MSDAERARTIWVVMHPEHRVQMEVPARTHEEAHRAAWQIWYRRPVRDGLDELMRDAFFRSRHRESGRRRGMSARGRP